MSNVHYLPLPPVRAIEPQTPSVRSYAEALTRSLRTHPDAERIPTHLYIALVDVLDAIVTRVERDRG